MAQIAPFLRIWGPILTLRENFDPNNFKTIWKYLEEYFLEVNKQLPARKICKMYIFDKNR